MPLKVKVIQSCRTLCNPHERCSPWNSPGKNTGVRSRSLLQGIVPTQGLNPSLPHCRQILYQLSHRGSPNESESCSVLSDSLQLHVLDSPGSSPGQNTKVGNIFPSPADLPNPRIEPGSPALQADSSPAELDCGVLVEWITELICDI